MLLEELSQVVHGFAEVTSYQRLMTRVMYLKIKERINRMISEDEEILQNQETIERAENQEIHSINKTMTSRSLFLFF
jgi:hypothetical protein